MLEEFWCDPPKIGFVEIPGYNKHGVRVHGLLFAKMQKFLECCIYVGLRGGMKTAVMMTAVNSLGNQNSRHRSVGYSRSGEQRDCIGCAFLRSHHKLLIMKHTPPTLLFPGISGILSAGCMKKPMGSMAKSGTSRDIQVSMRQIIEQYLISHWKEICAIRKSALSVHRVYCPGIFGYLVAVVGLCVVLICRERRLSFLSFGSIFGIVVGRPKQRVVCKQQTTLCLLFVVSNCRTNFQKCLSVVIK